MSILSFCFTYHFMFNRRLPCHFNEEFLLNTYTNTEIEAEVRIAAYLQLMRCPSYGTVKAVKSTLESEEVNQGKALVIFEPWSWIKSMKCCSGNIRMVTHSKRHEVITDLSNRTSVDTARLLFTEKIQNGFSKIFQKFRTLLLPEWFWHRWVFL